MKALKLLFAATAAVTMTFAAEAAKTAKAVVADGGATLKFVYDETSYGTKGTHWFSVADAEAQSPSAGPPWYGCRSDVTKVVFDSSFAGYQPTHCGGWFCDFSKLKAIEGLANLNTSKVTSFYQMFEGCSSLTVLDLSGFDTSKVTNMAYMFLNCSALATIYASDSFVTTAVTVPIGVFTGCTALKGGNGTAYDSANPQDKTYARIDGEGGLPGYFSPPPPTAKAVVEDGTTLRFVYDNKEYGTKGEDWFLVKDAEAIATDGSVPWYGCRETVTKVDFDKSFAKYLPTKCYRWFYEFEKLDTIENIGNLDTSAVKNFGYMFGRCSSLASIDVTGFDTSAAVNMNGMFVRCSSLKSLDVTGFDTSKVTAMLEMFSRCSSLKSLDVTRFNTSRVTTMAYMFYLCSSLKSLDVTGFDTSKVTSMNYMFDGCSLLETIIASDGFATTTVAYSTEMFSGCTALVGGKGTKYDGTKTDKTYALIDGGPSAPGYFTQVPVYTVAFDGNGATSGTMVSCTCRIGQVYTLPKCAFTKTGKTFKGWAGSNGKRYDDGVLIFNAAAEGATLTLTAIWE